MTTDTRSTRGPLLRMTLFLLRAAMVVFFLVPAAIIRFLTNMADSSFDEIDKERNKAEQQNQNSLQWMFFDQLLREEETKKSSS